MPPVLSSGLDWSRAFVTCMLSWLVAHLLHKDVGVIQVSSLLVVCNDLPPLLAGAKGQHLSLKGGLAMSQDRI
eukprot:scaffold165712_cov18-Tisochrysis_lutea.AAC.5